MKHNHPTRLLCLLAAVLFLLLPLYGCAAANRADMEYEPSIQPSEEAKGADEAAISYSLNSVDDSGAADTAYERKVIRTAMMDCETQDFGGAVTAIFSYLKANDGYVESESVRGTGYKDTGRGDARCAQYTFRVPSGKLDAFMDAMRTEGGIRITRQNMGSQEVTAAYYDLTSRLGTLEAEKEALSAMLAGFTDYSNIQAMLDVQKRLYDVIEEIEAAKTQLNIYDSRVAMSTVELTLNEVITYTEEEEPSFGTRMKQAFTESWTNFAHGWMNFCVWFVDAFPTLLILAAVGVGIFFIVRAIVQKSKKK